MPLVGLKEASNLTGKNQSTIHRAMKSGRISFIVNDIGERMMDPAELDRVFPINRPGPELALQKSDAEIASNVVQSPEIAELRTQVAAEREKMALLQERLADKDGVIEDLRQRLNLEGEERRRTQAQLTALLLDQRPRHEFVVDPLPRRSWWRFGRR
jgi:hypothetical protein